MKKAKLYKVTYGNEGSYKNIEIVANNMQEVVMTVEEMYAEENPDTEECVNILSISMTQTVICYKYV